MRQREQSPLWLDLAVVAGMVGLAWAIERPQRPVDPEQRAQAPSAVPSRDLRLYRRPWAWWRQVILHTYREVGNDRLLAVAAGVVFYALLALFPAVTAFVSFYGLFAGYATISNHLDLLAYVMPAGGFSIVNDQVERIVTNNDSKLSMALVAGVAIALWSANSGVKAMIDALNVIEGVDERRGFVRLNAVSLGFTFGAIVFLLIAIGTVVAFPLVMSTFGMERVTSTATWLVRWPLMLIVVMLALSVLFRFGPSHERRRWRLFSPGIVFAAIAWLAGSAGLSFYLSNFANYNATYGSLGAAIGLMMWMWLTAIVVLVGAELDSEADKLRSVVAS